MKINKMKFGKLPSGEEAQIYEIITDNGLKVKVTNYGATVTELHVPDRYGNIEDIVLGFDNLKQYLGAHPYFGSLIGRYGNRIGNAKFSIDGIDYKLTANENGNTLHGGKGFNRVLWKAEEIVNTNEAGLKFSYLSKHLEDGFPGNLKVEVIYLFTNNNEFKVSYFAIE